MDISCSIIRDLLPLYAEDLLSEDSVKLVDAHLCTCDPCTRQLGILKKAAVLPADIETSSLKRVGNTIRRRRILAVMAAVFTVFSIAVTSVIYMLTPVYLSVEEAIEGVELREDGGLAIDYASGIIGTSGYATTESFGNWGIMCDTTRYDWLQAKREDTLLEGMSQDELEAYILSKYNAEEMTQSLWDRFHNIRVEYGTWTLPDGEMLHTYDPEIWVEGNGEWTNRRSDINHWYLNLHTGEAETQLWQGSAESNHDDEMMSYVRPQYGYGILFIGTAAVSAACWYFSRRLTGWKRECMERISILCASAAVSTLLVTGGVLVIGEMWVNYKWREYICTETVFLTLTALFWLRLYKLNRQDRGA